MSEHRSLLFCSIVVLATPLGSCTAEGPALSDVEETDGAGDSGSATDAGPSGGGRDSAPAVDGGSAFTVHVSSDKATVAQPIRVEWTAKPGASSTARIGLYLESATDTPGNARLWIPVGTKTAGSVTVAAPCSPGVYDFRYLPTSSSRAVAAARSSPVTISAAAGDPPQACIGCTIYVAMKGSDGASGTKDDPIASLRHAARIARAGDTVCVLAGTYGGFASERGELRGTAAKPIVFKPFEQDKVIIDQAITY